ncbi:MAG: FAD-binding oxidoreductase [Nocardioidaceae bacterium]
MDESPRRASPGLADRSEPSKRSPSTRRMLGLGRHSIRTAAAGVVLVAVLVCGLHFEQYTGAPGAGQDCTVRAATVPTSGTTSTTAPPGAIGMAALSAARLRKVAGAYPRWLTQVRGTVNDASCLNATPVYGVARPTDIGEVRQALQFAATHDLTVVTSGTRHAMGGQNAAVGALVLDMRDLATVRIDDTNAIATVGAGAIWRNVLEAAHTHDLAVAAMPSIDTLSVGGTLSVNAHGADFRVGSLASTVRSLTVVTADGQIHRLSRTREPELFGAVIGGYGLFGVIVEADLELVPNQMYELRQTTVAVEALPSHLHDDVFTDPTARLTYAHLSTSPASLLSEAIVYTHHDLENYPDSEPMPPLRSEQNSRFGRLVLNLARHGGLAQRAKWVLQRDLLPTYGVATKHATRRCAPARPAWSRATRPCTTTWGCCGTRCLITPTCCRSTSCHPNSSRRS